MTDMHAFWLLTGKYLSGEINDQEKATLLALLESDPVLRDEFDEAKKMWEQTAGDEPGYDSQLLQRTHQKIREYEAGERQAPELPPYEHTKETPVYTLPGQRNGWKKWIAAAVLTGISVCLYWFFQNNPATSPVKWASLDVLPGKQQKIILADSSVVYVNAGSHIEYPLAFTDSVREIRLNGEAFFEVAQDAGKPFIVQSGALRTRVLGTSFNVRAYSGEEMQSVWVATGKVQVNTAEKTLGVLLPDHLLTYHVQGKNFALSSQPHETMDWQQNRMAFNDIPFKDLAAELGRRYGKTLVFSDPSMQHCRYRAVFRDLPLEKILQQLSLTNGFRYTAKGDSIFLEGKGCE
ncbi:FecR domain-containing protein [Chitinophaga sp. 22620]|uniref:FecR domain-containing protein n=1 Tax=Chitinophaga sp. 22620 TaxID=3453952 RepID=UPI003F871849